MANKVKIDYSQFRASGVYTLEFDASQNVILTSQTIRLVVGFSNKGPFNTPVYIPDVTTLISIFGDVDRSLENNGSFFQRSILTCLNAGPVFALNLLKVNDDITSADPDTVTYKSYSLDTEEINGVPTSKLYSSYYNKERFWFPDTNYFLATLGTVDQGKLLNLTNLGKSPMSIIIRKSSDSSKPIKGYDIFAVDWYGSDKVPTFMNPYDYMSDYFIDVIGVYGDWTNYQALALDPKWSNYFTNNGFKKSMMDSFLASPDVSIVTSVTGCIIPDFVDLNGINQYIQTLINNNTPSSGLFCAIDERAFDDICESTSRIDLVGHHLIDGRDVNNEFAITRVNFLSYDQALSADYLYAQNSIGITGATGFTGPVGGTAYTAGINTGTLFTLTGATSGVISGSFLPYSSSAYDMGLHYLETSGVTGSAGGFETAAQKTQLKTFLSVSSSSDQKFILGVVTGVSGTTATGFAEADLIKLKVTGTKEIGGELRIYFTHPLDTSFYRGQGIVVKPTDNLASLSSSLYAASYQFGNSDYIDIASIATPSGITGPGAPFGVANTLIGYNASKLYQDNKYAEVVNSDVIWLDTVGTQQQHLGFESTVDRDLFSLVYARSFSNESLDNTTITDIAAFGTDYTTYGTQAGAGTTNIVSQVGSINSLVPCTSVDEYTILITNDSNGNAPLSVGDLLVSKEVDICTSTTGATQKRLTKVKSVAKTTTSGTYKVIAARPIEITSNSEVRKFQSIAQFTKSFNFTYLNGFKTKAAHRPNGTDARVTELLEVLYTTNIAKTLASKDIISFRYIVDTFSGQILPSSKNELSRLAKLRQQSLAIINAPSIAQFRNSTDPRFTDEPTSTNPYPKLNTSYIVSGGNLALNPTYTFSLPTDDEGARFSAFYSPYIVVRDGNRNVNIPPAAHVSNNFIRKFANGEPYAIIAGQKRGILSGGNVVGVEYEYDDDDRGNLEVFGINPIVKRKGVGVIIFGNQTAYQEVNSAFNLVHVRDLLISIESDVQEILANYLFDFNEDSIRLEIKTLVDNYLDGVRSGGGIYSYQTIMDASNNTPAIIDKNMGIIDVIVEPTRGIQKFINRITVTRTGGIAAGGFIQFV
jgi:hypothetical protein